MELSTLKQTSGSKEMQEQIDKRVYMDNLAVEAERAATHQERGTVFRITKHICGGSHRAT